MAQPNTWPVNITVTTNPLAPNKIWQVADSITYGVDRAPKTNRRHRAANKFPPKVQALIVALKFQGHDRLHWDANIRVYKDKGTHWRIEQFSDGEVQIRERSMYTRRERIFVVTF